MELQTTFRWRLGLLVAIVIALYALYPQVKFWLDSRGDWHGSYTMTQADETAYAAYINALLSGRPRRNDPISGRDERAGQPLPESLFSIQFVPAYATVAVARIFGLNASQVFILLPPLTGFLSTLAIFWLLCLITKDEVLASVGAVCILCLGTLAAGEGVIRDMLGLSDRFDLDYLPFLRRYQPSVTFPLFFVLCGWVWRTLTTENMRSALLSSFTAGLLFVLLIFSYFYLWTAAAAWLACVTFVWLVAHRAQWRSIVARLSPIFIMALCGLVPYILMLANRAKTVDKVQILEVTRAPDIFRWPEIIGMALLALLFFKARTGRYRLTEPVILFSISLACLPIAVFNQQIITGRTLQPIHYEVYITNYASLVAVMLALPSLWRAFAGSQAALVPRGALALLLLVALNWGWDDIEKTTKVVTGQNQQRDTVAAVAHRLEAMSAQAEQSASQREMVFMTDVMAANNLSSFGSHAVLWSTYVPIFPGVTTDESQERFFQYLYYSGVQPARLYWLLQHEEFEPVVALFGFERKVSVLTSHLKPLTEEEIQEAVGRYEEFVNTYDRQRASQPSLSYMVVRVGQRLDLANFDRWYERSGDGERIGNYIIYRVKLRA